MTSRNTITIEKLKTLKATTTDHALQELASILIDHFTQDGSKAIGFAKTEEPTP